MSPRMKLLIPASVLLLGVAVIVATGSTVGWSKDAFVPMSPYISAIMGACLVSYLWVTKDAV